MKTRTRPPVPLEGEIQKAAVAVLKANGIAVYRRNVVAMKGEHKGKRWFVRAGEPGQSDLWGIIPPRMLPSASPWSAFGRHYEIEIKRPGERPTLDQVRWLLRMNDLTGAACWCDDTGVLVKVMRCLIAGGRIEYLGGTRRYGGATGPSGDFDLRYPE